MNMRVVKTLTAFWLLLAAPWVAQADEAADKAAVEAAVVDFHRALAEGYREGIVNLIAPEAVVFETGYVEASRDQYVNGQLQADLMYAITVKREVVHRQTTVSGDMALSISQSRNKGEFQGESVNLTNTETMVLRRIDGDWKIVHIHWSGHEPPPAAAR